MPCRDGDYYDCIDCVDAWELSRLYGCNEAPHPLQNLDDVKPGDLVEFNQGGERIWGRVLYNCGCTLIVEVVSDLVFSHPFSKGDKVLLTLFQIYNWESQ